MSIRIKRKLLDVLDYVFWGALAGPALGMSLVCYEESEGSGWGALKLLLIANGKLAAALAIIGGAIGLIVGVVQAFRHK
jgi:hypothetical protein